jgi:hypothetical protein
MGVKFLSKLDWKFWYWLGVLVLLVVGASWVYCQAKEILATTRKVALCRLFKLLPAGESCASWSFFQETNVWIRGAGRLFAESFVMGA